MFRVGQRVVCVTNGWTHRVNISPKKGDVATITNIYRTAAGEEALELAEYPAPASFGFYAGWRADGFRPIVERKTDISVFTRILDDVNKVKESSWHS